MGHDRPRGGDSDVATDRRKGRARPVLDVPDRVANTDPEGVDYGWVLQTTFVLTIGLGAPLVAVLSLGVDLPTWTDRAVFAVRIGAVVWFLTAIAVFLYARNQS